MSALRRRFLGGSSTEPSRDVTSERGKEQRLVPISKLRNLTQKTLKSWKRRSGLIFGLGGLFGIVVAVFFVKHQDVVSFNGFMDTKFYENLLDVIPAGIVKEATDLQVNIQPSQRRENVCRI